MGSPHMYRIYAEYFLGRPAEDQAELDKMNLRLKIDNPAEVVATGYNGSFLQKCDKPSGEQAFLCTPLLGNSMSESLVASIGKSNETIIFKCASYLVVGCPEAHFLMNHVENEFLYTYFFDYS